MMEKKRPRWQALFDFYDLYTQGLTREEIVRLLKSESVDVLSFYRRKSAADRDSAADDSFPKKQLLFVWELFVSFILNMTPARRLFYGIACCLCLATLITGLWYYAVVAIIIFNLLIAFELADRMLAKDELEIAREIQVGLQPDENPSFPGVDIAVFYRPAKEVGGDYYDILPIDEQRFNLMLGDVSGKGLPAALYAVKLQGLFELLSEKQATPEMILSGINAIMARSLKKQFFITATAAAIDLGENKLTLARAGHLPPLHYMYGNDRTEWLKPAGVGIGINGKSSDNSGFDTQLQEYTLEFQRGDIFLFYTDGITEAMNQSGEEFGEERLQTMVMQNATSSACDIKEAIVDGLHGFVNKSLLDDDATVIVVKID